MQRFFNLNKWERLGDGKAVHFGNTTPRRVVLDVNSFDPVKLTYADPDGELIFLARVQGRDRIEFACHGEFSIIADGGELMFTTVDGEDFSFVIPDAVTLTRIAERRARNPEFEMMEYRANQNLERRLAQQRGELEELWARLQQDTAAAAAVAPAAAAPVSSAKEPEQAAGTDGDADGDGNVAERSGTAAVDKKAAK